MYNIFSFRLTKEQYNYLLPVCRQKLLYITNGIQMKNGDIFDLYAFTGTKEDYEDVLSRCSLLDGDLMEDSDYKERFEYNKRYNSGLYYKQVFC